MAGSDRRSSAALGEVLAARRGDVEPLFGTDYPNRSFVAAVLAGHIPGRVLAAGSPPVRCVITTGSPYAFLAGEATGAFVGRVLSRLSVEGDVKLVLPPGQELPVPLPEGAEEVGRVQFAFPAAPPARERTEIPDGFSLEPIDSALFGRLAWNVALDVFGDAEKFVEHGYGFCLTYRGEVAAEAYSVVGGGVSEPGVHTSPAFRGRGLQKVLLHRLLEEAERRGHRTVLSCDTSTHATIALARGLGMSREITYRAVRMPASERNIG
ncbi:GNAT family N-acetyltransferase [Streptomyces sp. ODS05-4]|uniref:GNAT family N-acetyltransferase n=1 Tax=Streptomyces sp. ODS05-4 TaxID=2944939 RepID=UPI00210E5BE9|nr:GNAT family N-acetyltransferase [Streptomyces sp. ODS05-4]